MGALTALRAVLPPARAEAVKQELLRAVLEFHLGLNPKPEPERVEAHAEAVALALVEVVERWVVEEDLQERAREETKLRRRGRAGAPANVAMLHFEARVLQTLTYHGLKIVDTEGEPAVRILALLRETPMGKDERNALRRARRRVSVVAPLKLRKR